MADKHQNDPNGSGFCPIWMGKECGREVHRAPPGIDEEPVCLMHSSDEAKQSGPLFEAFCVEFEDILKKAGDGEADFRLFVFPRLDLIGITIDAICDFSRATFTQDAHFFGATFTQNAYFSYAKFTQNAYFGGAKFTQDAYFSYAKFTQNADFRYATFSQDAYFGDATFTQNADFSYATFHETADWVSSKFLTGAEFRHTKFFPSCCDEHTAEANEDPSRQSADYGLAYTAKPKEVVFENVDLSRACFHNFDVTEIRFMSSVKWAQAGSRKAMIFEETTGLALDAVEQIYHQLKKNYDAQLDYTTANEFHFGEMEMRRKASKHPNLGLTAWYKHVSDYGNSYGKPLLWLLGLILFFAALFPIAELHGTDLKYTESYRSVWVAAGGWRTGILWEADLLLHKSLVATVDVAMFSRTARYLPATPVGHDLAVLENLLTSSVFGLFLLAIRRQYRR